ncbi:hypothetical protein TH53_07145 [Pedobacter lusitanus]|uniref:DUF1223 domain-containing protein n=1 Tax=Pedobacter lusitanus TaxID=1503925 RepID=A0A0D0F8C1_9SPHI|nr:DUF1223 domain-containing protein [Pedobacter lusitanus]KIO77893.1 hypothetical protein TH53_07145 [Pedobacter lusitanus]
MKTIKISGFTICLMLSILSLTACGQRDNAIQKNEGKGFAVLELFTSEGCSSCPPADELLAELQKDQQGKEVYLLAYHVDYWDRQGWKDVFSQADYSKRQVQYGHWLDKPQIYTPQVVINGKAEFVGSEEFAIRNAISAGLAEGPASALKLEAYQGKDGLNVHYQATGRLKGSVLAVAVVQKSAVSKVEGGENAGHTLSHVQIVRKLQTYPLSEKGDGVVTVAVPKDLHTADFEILGLLQDKNKGEILGAAKAEWRKL